MKNGYHVNCTVSLDFLLDKGPVAENLQKECLCYFTIYVQVVQNDVWNPHQIGGNTDSPDVVVFRCIPCQHFIHPNLQSREIRMFSSFDMSDTLKSTSVSMELLKR